MVKAVWGTRATGEMAKETGNPSGTSDKRGAGSLAYEPGGDCLWYSEAVGERGGSGWRTGPLDEEDRREGPAWGLGGRGGRRGTPE